MRGDIAFNVPKLLTAAGSAQNLIDLVEQTGSPTPTAGDIYTWKSRGRIPSRWVSTIIYVVLRHQLLTLADIFVTRRTSANSGN